MLTPALLISTTSLTTVISAVSSSFSLVSVPPTFAIFLIFPSMLSTSTVNFLVTVEFAASLTDQAISVCSSDTSWSCTDINFVPAGTVSVMNVVPSASPVFVTVIVYVILSPTFAVSTISPFLVITLDLLFSIIDVSVGFPSLLSSPFAIAVFRIVPVTGTSSPSSFNIASFTFTVNDSLIVSPAGIVAIHFTPTTVSFPFTVVPFISLFSSSLIDTKLVFCGILSVISMFCTSLFPLLVTSITYVMSWPTYVRFSSPVSVIADFFTVKSGVVVSKFATVDATATLIGVHQSQ